MFFKWRSLVRGLAVIFLVLIPRIVLADNITTADQKMTLTAVAVATILTAVLHTIVAPNHYLPFITIAKQQHYSLVKTLTWTCFCGLGHLAGNLILIILFVWFSGLLADFEILWLEEHRAFLAAYAMLVFGVLYLLFALYYRWKRRDISQSAPILQKSSSIPWLMFILFIIEPCESFLPVLTVASVLGTSAIIIIAILFSLATILTMMVAVAIGFKGLSFVHCDWLEKYAMEISGVTLILCGLAIMYLEG